MLDRDRLVAELLKRQSEIFGPQPPAGPGTGGAQDDWVPFAWMDPAIHDRLRTTLSPGQLDALDRAARANARGQSIMVQAVRRALAAAMGGKSDDTAH